MKVILHLLRVMLTVGKPAETDELAHPMKPRIIRHSCQLTLLTEKTEHSLKMSPNVHYGQIRQGVQKCCVVSVQFLCLFQKCDGRGNR